MVQYKQTSIAAEKRRSNHPKIQWALSSVCSFGTNQCHLCFKKEDKKKTNTSRIADKQAFHVTYDYVLGHVVFVTRTQN